MTTAALAALGPRLATALVLAPLLLWAASNGAAASPAAGEAAEGPAPAGGRQDRVILVTGSTGGLGREVARRLAAEGAHVIVHGRNEERGRALVEEIEAGGAGSARFYRADFASLDEVRGLADAVLRDYDRLDVLVNNAGILLSTDEPVFSDDGNELHFQVNYLAGFLLAERLLPLLERSAPARIVNVSSIAQAPVDFDAPGVGRPYGESKLAQIMFTLELAERLEGRGVSVNVLHPATMMDTDMVREMGAQPRTSVDEGADAVMHLVTASGLGSGGFFDGTTPARARVDQAYDEDARARLWTLSEELTGADWR